MRTYNVRRAIATIAGIAVIGAETNINFHHVYDRAAELAAQPLAQAILIAGLAQAAAAVIACAATRERRWIIATLATLGLAAAVGFTFATTYERVLQSREDRALTRDADNTAHRATRARIDSLKARAAAECTTRGTECRKREAELTLEQAALAGLGRERTPAMLGPLQIVPDLALPAMLLLLGFAFLGYAEAGRRDDGSSQTSFPADEHPLPDPGVFAPLEAPPSPAEVEQRRQMVRAFETAYERKHGALPRHRDIMRATGLPKATVSRMRTRRAAAG